MKPKIYLPAIVLMTIMPFLIQSQDKGAYNTEFSKEGQILNQSKYALLIGNSKYTNIKPLVSPELDVDAVGDSLKEIGVTVFPYKNLPLIKMKQALQDFCKVLTQECWAIFIYSGHGVEFSEDPHSRAINYLLPVDIKDDLLSFEYSEKAFSADWVTEELSKRTHGPKVIILDACRNNPFKSGGKSGLEGMQAQGNMIIAFAAAEGMTANDGGTGQLSTYSNILRNHIASPNRRIDEILIDVQFEMCEQYKDQKPFLSHGLEGKYYLNPAPTDPSTATLIVTSPEAGTLTVGNVISENIAAGTNTYKIPKGSYTLKFTGDISGSTYSELLSLTGGSIVPVSIPKVDKDDDGRIISPDLPKMIRVEGGTYRMGCTRSTSEYTCGQHETAHFVTVSSFRISETEMTNSQYCAFLNANMDKIDQFSKWIDIDSEYCKIKFFQGKFKTETGYENYPVVTVSWYGADAYCKWAGGRLPTEAEWEFAARGGNKATSDYIFAGSDDPKVVAWYGDNSGSAVHPVKMKKPNDLGLYDMSGNVWEWCSDWYGSDYFNSSFANNPLGPSSGSYRVLRGGSWSRNPIHCRVAFRDFNYPDFRDFNYGFRLVISH